MRRYLIAVLFFLAVAVGSRAQSGYTQVSATVLDPSGNPYAGCKGNANFVPSPSATTIPTIGGSTFQTVVVINQCDSFGHFTVTLADNNIVSDGHTSLPASMWNFAISSQDGKTSFFCKLTITGITQNISTQIQACAPPLPSGGGGGGGSKGTMYRLNIAGSTPLTAANFAFSGWGTGATISGISGTDTAFSFTMTAGTTPSINPTVVLTFADGPWTNIYSVNAQTDNGSGNQTYIQADNNLSSVTLTYLNLPQATKTYTITATVIGTTNVGNLASPLNAVVLNPQGNQIILGPSALITQGPLQSTGGITSGSVNKILVVDGIQYTTLAAAFSACPASGCTIDMRGNSSSLALALGSFDPGAKPVTLLLGPFLYTATTITLRTNFHIVGVGGTVIIEQSQTAPLMQGPPGTNGPALNVRVENVLLAGPGYTTGCAAGSTTATGDGVSINADQSANGGGLWYSQFSNMTACMFGGNAFHFRGDSASGHFSINQFISLYNVTGIRTLGGGSAEKIEGANFQIFHDNCEFDSNYLNSNIDPSLTPNIFIGAGPGSGTTGYPFIIEYDGTTSEGAAVAVQIDGASNVVFNGMHHEQAYGVYRITFGQNGAGVNTQGVVVENSSFDSDTGVHGGAGYLFNVATANASGIVFENNIYASTSSLPDAISIITSGANVKQENWSFKGQTGGTPVVANVETFASCTLVSGACTHTFSTPYVTGYTVFCTATGTTAANAMFVTTSPSAVIVNSSSGSDSQVVNIFCNNGNN